MQPVSDVIYVHPTATIGPRVSLARGVEIGPGVVCNGAVQLDIGVKLDACCILGGRPKIRGYDGPIGAVHVGTNTVLSEHVVVDAPSGELTSIGADCYVLPHCYIGHDCLLEEGVTLTSGVMLGGHVRIGAKATLGLGAVVHQRVTIGAYAMIGMGSVVNRDVPPFAKVVGNPGRVIGANRVGMERAGMEEEHVMRVRKAFDAYMHYGKWLQPLGRDEVEWFAFVRRGKLMRLKI